MKRKDKANHNKDGKVINSHRHTANQCNNLENLVVMEEEFQ